MKNRSENVEILRFIAALLIMAHHMYHIRMQNYPFYDCWVYVEFFLFITGYYTAKHYSSINAVNKSKDAVVYTIKKFIPIFPYCFAVSLLAWLTNAAAGALFHGWTWQNVVSNFLGDFSFDILLISESYTHPLVAPLWYVSAMLLVFPLFALLIQMKNRYTKAIIFSFVPLIYYGCVGVTFNREFPLDLTRVFCGMMLGALIFEISDIFKEYIKSIPTIILTIIEIICVAFPIISCFLNLATYRLDLLWFFISLLICLPGFSYTNRIHGKLLNYLGKLSMPMFIFHWYVGTLVGGLSERLVWSNLVSLIIYYCGTIAISIFAMAIVNRWKWYQKIMKAPLELID